MMGSSPSTPSQTPLPSKGEGEVDVGSYRITVYPSIGSGSFGQVCKALNIHSRHWFAAKGIKVAEHGHELSKLKQMALVEGENMKRVSHPNIVTFYDYCEHKDTIWLFMEFCELGDLEKYLATYPEISLYKRLQIMHEMAQAIFCLHHNDPPIIHRDIKPENILIKRIGKRVTSKLTDFGFAKLYDYSLSQSGTSFYTKLHQSMKGTPRYMAPEFFLEETGLAYTATVDIFSLGLLYAIMLDYSPDNMSTFPLSVQARKTNTHVVFGREMADSLKNGHTLPSIVESTPDDSESEQILKENILQMTSCKSKRRPKIQQVNAVIEYVKEKADNALLPSMLYQDLGQAKQVTLSNLPWSLRLLGNKLWICQDDAIAIYNLKLNLVRSIPLGKFQWVYNVAQLPDKTVVAAGAQVSLITPTGDFIRTLVKVCYWDVAVHQGKLYASANEVPAIHVYSCSTWRKLRTIQTPCWNEGHERGLYWHYLSITNDVQIKLCCSKLNMIYILNAHGSVASSHGPDCDIVQVQNKGIPIEVEVISRSLDCPHLCQEDEDGSLLVADEANHCLLIFGEAGQCREVKLNKLEMHPIGATWKHQCLYVCSRADRCLTMYKEIVE